MKSVKPHILCFLTRSMGAAIFEKLSLNSLYHSTHAAHSQKLSLKGVFKTGIIFIVAKSDKISKKAHLTFSCEISGGCHISLNSLYCSTHATHSQKLSLSANSAHLVFSCQICRGCHIGKTLYVSNFSTSRIFSRDLWGLPCWKNSLHRSLNGKKVLLRTKINFF